MFWAKRAGGVGRARFWERGKVRLSEGSTKSSSSSSELEGPVGGDAASSAIAPGLAGNVSWGCVRVRRLEGGVRPGGRARRWTWQIGCKGSLLTASS